MFVRVTRDGCVVRCLTPTSSRTCMRHGDGDCDCHEWYDDKTGNKFAGKLASSRIRLTVFCTVSVIRKWKRCSSDACISMRTICCASE